MDTRALSDAFAISTIAGTSSLIVATADAATADTTSMFSSLGVFGAALAIAYFMLKRGDRRETDLMQHARELDETEWIARGWEPGTPLTNAQIVHLGVV